MNRSPDRSFLTPAPLALLALILLTLLTHGRDVFHDFVEWDDQELVAQHAVLNPVSADHLRQVWTGPTKQLYTPLAYTVWMAVALVARVGTVDSHGATLMPAAFHALNLLLHVGCVTLVFDVLRLLLPLSPGEGQGALGSKSTPRIASLAPHPDHLPVGEGTGIFAAAIGAAVFAVHPIQVEAVAWISGMNNLLAALFSLGCIATYIRFTRTRRPAWNAAAIVCVVLAYFSKPTAIVTPVVLVAIDWFILRRRLKVVIVTVLPIALLAVPFVIAGRTAQAAAGVYVPPVLQRLVIAGDAIGFYLQKLAWPTPLLMDYSRTPEWVLQHDSSLGACVSLAIVAVGVAVTLRRWPWVAAATAVFVAGFCIVLGLVPFSFQSNSTVADRYVYLAMLGPAFFVTRLLLTVHRPTFTAIAAVVVLLWAVISFVQAGRWTDTITLCNYTLSHNDRSLAARAAVGAAYRNAGDMASAEANYRAALAIKPTDFVNNYDWGNLLRDTDPAAALERYRIAQQSAPDDPRLLLNMGIALFKTGQVEQAVDVYRSVLRMNPADVGANVNLGNCLATLGRFDEAEQCFRTALEYDPNSALAARGIQKLAAVRAASQANHP